METVNNIELRDENLYPDNKVLEEILGPSFEAYRIYWNYLMRIIWNIRGDIIKMGRPGCVKYRKKEEPLYGCQPGKAICKQ